MNLGHRNDLGTKSTLTMVRTIGARTGKADDKQSLTRTTVRLGVTDAVVLVWYGDVV
jgi:hypothetical protein